MDSSDKTAPSDREFRFGEYRIDLATRALYRAGEPVALQPRVFDLLVFLLRERHRAVDKDEIQDAVWAPLVVSETALTRAIMKARRAVGDDADRQVVIRTVHGHGYQFVAPLEDVATAVAESSQASADPGPSSAAPSEALHRRLRWLLGATAVAVIAAVFYLRQPTRDPGELRIAVMPVVNATGDAELDWAKYGLMGLANDLFDDGTDIATVDAADVVRYAESTDWDGDLGADGKAAAADSIFAQLRDTYGASHVLAAQLESNVGGLRLNYVLVAADGRQTNATMVADQSTALVRGMVRSVATTLSTRRHVLTDGSDAVDDDPFINEAYARAVSLSIEGRCLEAAALYDVVLARNPSVIRARIERAHCRYRLGEWQAAEDDFIAMLDEPRVKDSPAILSELLAALGRNYHTSGRHDLADQRYQEALDVAEAHQDFAGTGRVLVSMAILAKDRRDFSLARELLARSRFAYRQLDRDVLPGQIFSTLANIAMNDGTLAAAEQHLDSALASFRHVGDRRNEAMMLNNYGYLRRLQGRFREAEDLHERSLAIRRDIGDTVGQGRILGMLSILYERDGRYAAARDAAAEALAIARAANDRLFIATGLAQLGTAERNLGATAAARAAWLESREIFLEIEDVSRALQVELRLASLDLDAGEVANAETSIQSVLTGALDADLPEPAIEALAYAGELEERRDQRSAAASFYERALELIDDSGVTTEKPRIASQLAGLYLDRGEAGRAEPLLGVLTESEAGSARLVRLEARHALAMGEAARAQALLARYRDLAADAWGPADDELAAAIDALTP